MSLNPPTNNGAAPVSIDQMLAARTAPATAVDAKEIGLWSQARGGIVDCLLEKVGKGYVVRVKGEPEIVGAGVTPEQASLACLAAIPGKTAAPQQPTTTAEIAGKVSVAPVPMPPAGAPVAPISVIAGTIAGVDMTPPPGEKPYSGKGRHPAWLKARIAQADGLKADDSAADAAAAAPVVTNVPVPLTAAAVAAPPVDAATALRKALAILRAAEAARHAAERAETEAAAGAEKARAAFEAWLSAD